MLTAVKERPKTKSKDKNAPKKCVVLLSGGIDSTVLLYSLVNEYKCYPVSILYGQKHSKEVMAARNICEVRDNNLLQRWSSVDLRDVRHLLKSALTGTSEIPDGHYEDVTMKQTVVPNRNLIMLSIAAGYADSIGAEAVAFAAHAGDHFIYPDCTPGFVRATGLVLDEALEGRVELLAPFVHTSKADIVSQGSKLNVPFRLTWSCYKGGEYHCGKCGTCFERREAFQRAGVDDPTKYV